MPELSFSRSLDKALKEYGIKVNWLAEKSGVPPQTISSFKNGHQQMQTGNLEKLIASLPFEVQQFLMADLLGHSPRRPSLPTIIEQLEPESPNDRKEAADAMRLIAARFLNPV
jgi:hypothetical protein